MIPNGWTNSKCLYSRILLNMEPTGMERCQIIIYSIYQSLPLTTELLTGNFLLCLYIPQTVNNPILYAAIITLWLVKFPDFPIIQNISGIVNVMSVVVPVSACVLILGSLEAIIISQRSQPNPEYKVWNNTISMHTGKDQPQSLWNEGDLFLVCWSDRNFQIMTAY
jgi:hypothetical protein